MPKKNNVKNIKTDIKTKNQKGGQNNEVTSSQNNTKVDNTEQTDETTNNNNVPFVKVTTVKLNNTISKNAEVADREGWVGYLCTIM